MRSPIYTCNKVPPPTVSGLSFRNSDLGAELTRTIGDFAEAGFHIEGSHRRIGIAPEILASLLDVQYDGAQPLTSRITARDALRILTFK